MSTLPIPSGTEITPEWRDRWLELRRRPGPAGHIAVLGSSQLAQAVGLSPYGGPLQLWGQMRGLEPPFEGNALTRKGNYLQPWVEDEYQRQTGKRIARREVFTVGPTYHGVTLVATLDGITETDDVFEAKTTGWRSSDRWGAAGTDLVPAHNYIQVQGQLFIADRTAADLVAAIGDDEPKIYPIGISVANLAPILCEAEKFCWHVSRGIRPAYAHEEDRTTMLRAVDWTGSTLAGDEDLARLIAEWENLGEAVSRGDEAKKRRRQLADRIGERLAGHATAQLPDGRTVCVRKVTCQAREQTVQEFSYLRIDVKDWE